MNSACVAAALLLSASALADSSVPANDPSTTCHPPRAHIAAVREYCRLQDTAAERRACRFVERALEACDSAPDDGGRSLKVLAQEPACDYDVFELDFRPVKHGWQVVRFQRVTYHDR